MLQRQRISLSMRSADGQAAGTKSKAERPEKRRGTDPVKGFENAGFRVTRKKP